MTYSGKRVFALIMLGLFAALAPVTPPATAGDEPPTPRELPCEPGPRPAPWTGEDLITWLLGAVGLYPPHTENPLTHEFSGDTYTNPVIEMPGGDVGDPDVVLDDGTWYLYASRDFRPPQGYRVYTSSDLVDWVPGPVVFDPPGKTAWAPDVFHHAGDGRFYLYYTTNEKIGVASSSSPLGPFEDHGLIVAPGIDAELFADVDGRLYLFWQAFDLMGTIENLAITYSIFGTEMDSPMQPTRGSRRRVLAPSQDWEANGMPLPMKGLVEAPHLMRRDGRYMLTYSGGVVWEPSYNVGLAWGDAPLGPYEKSPCNPIIAKGEGVTGPGHHTFVETANGRLWMVYHGERLGRRGYAVRDIYVDPVTVDGDRLHVDATRDLPREKPSP